MKKIVALLTGAFLLVSCGKQTVTELPGSEVLVRSLLATAVLESVAFQGESQVVLPSASLHGFSGAVMVSGVLVRRTGQASIGIWAEGIATDDPLHPQVRIASTTEIAPNAPAEMRISEWTVGTGSNVPDLLGRWWSVPSFPLTLETPMAIPNPDDIDRQAKSFIIESSSLEAGLKGPLYQLHVRLGTGAVMFGSSNARGELWINAQTFHLQRAVWHLPSIPVDGGSASAEVDVEFSDHNRASLPMMRERKDLQELPLSLLFGSASTLPTSEEMTEE